MCFIVNVYTYFFSHIHLLVQLHFLVLQSWNLIDITFNNSFDTDANKNVLNATIEYILSNKRFDEPLFQRTQKIFKQCYESLYSVIIAVVTCIIVNFYFIFYGFVLFPSTLTILGTWWLSLLILQYMI